MTPLRERMIGDLRLRNIAETSIECYVRVVRKYAEFFGPSPDKLSSEKLRKYLLYIREEKKVAQGTYNQVVAALRFFYRITLGRPATIEGVCFTKGNKKLPVELSIEEVRASTRFNPTRCIRSAGNVAPGIYVLKALPIQL